MCILQIVAKECGVLGVETSSDALERSGLMTKVPQVQKEAILIYEYIKRKTKEEGHTCVKFDSIMDYFGSQISLIEEAHQFLEKNKVSCSVKRKSKDWCENLIFITELNLISLTINSYKY